MAKKSAIERNKKRIRLASKFAAKFNGKHMAFDPIEQGVVHGAVKSLFGQDQLPTFDIANATRIADSCPD